MLKATNTNTTTISANGTLQINLVKNTFSYVTLKDNVITIRKPGTYQIVATLNGTATGTNMNVGLYNNDVLIPETEVEIDTTSGDVYEIVINDYETVIATPNFQNEVKLSFKTVGGLTQDTINVSVVEIR